jgi:hypothetical protein
MQAVIYPARSKEEEEGEDSTGHQVAAIGKRIGNRTVSGGPHIDRTNA